MYGRGRANCKGWCRFEREACSFSPPNLPGCQSGRPTNHQAVVLKHKPSKGKAAGQTKVKGCEGLGALSNWGREVKPYQAFKSARAPTSHCFTCVLTP